jgi:hypothetical protein
MSKKRKFDEVAIEKSLSDLPIDVIVKNLLPFLEQKTSVPFTMVCKKFWEARREATWREMPLRIPSILPFGNIRIWTVADEEKVTEIHSVTRAWSILLLRNDRDRTVDWDLVTFLPNVHLLSVSVKQWLTGVEQFNRWQLTHLTIAGHDCTEEGHRRTRINLETLPATLLHLHLMDSFEIASMDAGRARPNLTVYLHEQECVHRSQYSIRLNGLSTSFACDAKVYAKMHWANVTMPSLRLFRPGNEVTRDMTHGPKHNSMVQDLFLEGMGEDLEAIAASSLDFLLDWNRNAFLLTASHGVKVDTLHVRLDPWDWYPFCYALIKTMRQFPGSYQKVIVTQIQPMGRQHQRPDLPAETVPIGPITFPMFNQDISKLPHLAFSFRPDEHVVKVVLPSDDPGAIVPVLFTWPWVL